MENERYVNNGKPEAKLIQYFDLVKEGNIIDLGIGDGRNILPFIAKKFNLEGIDISEEVLIKCRKNIEKKDVKIELSNFNITEVNIKPRNYSLIIAANVLNFFKTTEIIEIIKKMKNALVKDGIIYLSVFSNLDPRFNMLKTTKQEVEENTFYLEKEDKYEHFFEKDELVKYFSDFELISYSEGIEYDFGHGEPHYHGVIEFMVRKKVL